jgi:hypothetical protein
MQRSDLVRVRDKFNVYHFGIITDIVDMDDELLYVVTFFNGEDAVIHPSRIEVLKNT